jgi:hypothetical protein
MIGDKGCLQMRQVGQRRWPAARASWLDVLPVWDRELSGMAAESMRLNVDNYLTSKPAKWTVYKSKTNNQEYCITRESCRVSPHASPYKLGTQPCVAALRSLAFSLSFTSLILGDQT